MSSSGWTKPGRGQGPRKSQVIGSTSGAAAAAEYAARWPRSNRCASAAAARGQATERALGAEAQLSLLPLFAPAGPVTVSEAEGFRLQLLALLGSSRRGRGAQVDLTITNNHSTMISVRRSEGRYRLRLHRMFLGAGHGTLAALARYITDNDRLASAELGEFIESQQAQFPPPPARPRVPRILTIGQHHDLQQLFERLNSRYFRGAIDARITWGKSPAKRSRPRRHSSLKLGSYSVEDRLIRIHPTLDQPGVPAFFVEWIIYHEMLHQKHPIPVVAGRRRFHTPAFLAEERLFDEYERARQWERRNLHRLLVF